MKFMRRPDIDTVARVHIAAQAFLGLWVYGEITRIAHCYRVSRLFVYKLLWQLMTLYVLEVHAVSSVQALRPEVDRHILLLRLEGYCSLESISQILRQLGLPFASVGYISQRLTAYAQSLPKDGLTGARIVFLLWDEIFTRGQPILLTIEPRSLAILITGCEFSGAQTLPALAAGEANSGGCVWGRQKSTWHSEATCGMKCA